MVGSCNDDVMSKPWRLLVLVLMRHLVVDGVISYVRRNDDSDDDDDNNDDDKEDTDDDDDDDGDDHDDDNDDDDDDDDGIPKYWVVHTTLSMFPIDCVKQPSSIAKLGSGGR